MLKIPTLIHEQNGVLGRVNRAFAPKVDLVACGTWPTPVPAGTRAVHVGNPVRAAVLDRHEATYLEPGDHPIGLLVIGGSQGAGLFGRVVPEALRLLDPAVRGPARLAQQVGPRTWTGSAPPTRTSGMAPELRTFFDDVPDRLAEASLVISRAGASLDRRHQRHRAAGDPHPLRRGDGRPPGGERRRARRGGRGLHDPRGGVDGGGARGAHRRDPRRPRRARARWRRRAGRRGARTRPSIWRRWSRTSPRKEDEPHERTDAPPPRHRGDPLRRHRRHRHVGDRRGAAQPRLHRAGLGRQGLADHRAAGGEGRDDLHRPAGREPRGRAGRRRSPRRSSRATPSSTAPAPGTCRSSAAPRCSPSSCG